MQKIVITGNIGADATVETYGNDTVIRFRVACNSRFTNRAGEVMDDVTWYSCSYWNVNPNLATLLLKGRRVYVEGIPRNRVYQNQNDLQWYVSNDIRVLFHEMEDAHPANRQQPVNVPTDATVVQPNQVRPSEYHQRPQQQTTPSAPATITMPERMVTPTPTAAAPNPAQNNLFTNSALQLPETPQNNISQETHEIAEEPVKSVIPDLPY